MKFLYSDTQDLVDPDYDFITDRNAPGRRRYWDDMYAHELMTPAPYNGLLVAMSAVRAAPGIPNSKVRYSTAEEQRLLRDGVRKFLRYGGPKYKDSIVMGDCGAFAYADHDKPAYEPSEVFDFYADACFTHGISPDHIIFDCDTSNPTTADMPEGVINRYDITLENARKFLKICKNEGTPFQPIATVQGWSPKSMAKAATELQKIGYDYLAVGGLVPLKVDVIHQVLHEIRSAIRPGTRIHLLGFAKADNIQDFVKYDIASFDSTSPLIRAFKDQKANYYIESPEGGLEYYAAVRIPQSIENSRLMQGIKKGTHIVEDLQRREAEALDVLRRYDKGHASLDQTLDTVLEYQTSLLHADSKEAQEKAGYKARELMHRTLKDMPWKRCKCDICSAIGVEVIIFRSSNRNRRRGFHNLGVYHKHVQKILENHIEPL
jgi:hypothetical protein